jgi:hypothetical protein
VYDHLPTIGSCDADVVGSGDATAVIITEFEVSGVAAPLFAELFAHPATRITARQTKTRMTIASLFDIFLG